MASCQKNHHADPEPGFSGGSGPGEEHAVVRTKDHAVKDFFKNRSARQTCVAEIGAGLWCIFLLYQQSMLRFSPGRHDTRAVDIQGEDHEMGVYEGDFH